MCLGYPIKPLGKHSSESYSALYWPLTFNIYNYNDMFLLIHGHPQVFFVLIRWTMFILRYIQVYNSVWVEVILISFQGLFTLINIRVIYLVLAGVI
jgi:hypothetical protein